MNTKLKYTLAFVVVLLIGFVLGFLVSGRLIHDRVNRMQKYYTPKGFRYEMRRVLRPTPEQIKKMRPVLEKYARRNRENMMDFRQRQAELLQNLFRDLKPFLTPQQVERLKRVEERRMRFMQQRKMQHRPVPPGGPH